MELHDPSNLDLPPLRMKLRIERQAIEESPDVAALIGTKLLLDIAFHSLFMALLEKSKKVLELLQPTPPPSLPDLSKARGTTFENFVVQSADLPEQKAKQARFGIPKRDNQAVERHAESAGTFRSRAQYQCPNAIAIPLLCVPQM
jgi:hypothetical protein